MGETYGTMVDKRYSSVAWLTVNDGIAKAIFSEHAKLSHAWNQASFEQHPYHLRGERKEQGELRFGKELYLNIHLTRESS